MVPRLRGDDVWIPAYRRQARWNLPSNFVIGGEYDNNSDYLDTFARDSRFIIFVFFTNNY